jgi:hypothetical protein
MEVLASYSDGKHGFAVKADGITYPQAKTEVGAKRIYSRWVNSGLEHDFIRRSIGCGWTTRGVIKVWRAEVKKVKAILAAE